MANFGLELQYNQNSKDSLLFEKESSFVTCCKEVVGTKINGTKIKIL